MQVATSTMNALLLSHSLKVQADHAQALTQQASGVKSPSLAGLDGAAGHTISLTSDLETSAHLVAHAQSAQSMVELSYQSVAGLADLVAEASAQVAGAINGTVGSTEDLKSRSEAWLRDAENTLNTDFAGTYVFGGAGTTAPPVNLDATGYDAGADAADTRYYQGTAHSHTIMVDGGNRLDYGVTADAAGFEAALRALGLLSNMETEPPDTALLQDASALLDTAAQELGRMQEDLSGQADSLSALIDRETEFQLFAESALENLESVDIAEAAARVSELEVVLEASYSALASITSVSLLDYLR